MNSPRDARAAAAASVVIPTCNRVDELRALLRSLEQQTVALEILVMDDAASDATREMVAKEFPSVRYFRLGTRCGPAFQRNRGIELASSAIVFPVDDDTTFASASTIRQTLDEFDDPAIAAVGIPYINVRQDDRVRQRAPGPEAVFVTDTFVGAAHAVRRDVFVRLGGYREHFFYMGEEGDYCLRAMDNGYVVRLGLADPILHHESPRRSFRMVDHYAPRNLMLFAWHNVPATHLAQHLVASFAKAALHTLKPGRLATRLNALGEGLSMICRRKAVRAPVRVEAYRLMRQLKTQGPRPIAEAKKQLARDA